MLQSLLQVVLEWVLGTQTPSNRVFGALGFGKNFGILLYPEFDPFGFSANLDGLVTKS